MNTLDKQYQNLIKDILENGVNKNDRTGTGTISVFGKHIRHDMKSGFPLLTTKKIKFDLIVTELIWFLRGDTSIEYLLKQNCNIWTGDAYQAYLKKNLHTDGITFTREEFVENIKTDKTFAQRFGNLGKIYGFQWRHWGGRIDTTLTENPRWWKPRWWKHKKETNGLDQIQNLITNLKTDPDSRRLLVSAWNPSDLPDQLLPPCHYEFQLYTRELSLDERLDCLDHIWNKKFDLAGEENKTQFDNTHLDTHGIPKRAISLLFNMRSTDVGLGLGFNLASYGLLLMMIAKQVNMIPDELIYVGGDVHIYKNHIEQLKEQSLREPYQLPTVKLSDRKVSDISEYTLDDILLENYKYHPAIKMELSN